jgi:hypothetical protein
MKRRKRLVRGKRSKSDLKISEQTASGKTNL